MTETWIEHYSFGKIVIDGVTYTKDVILLGRRVVQGWRRKEGHILNHEDLEVVREYCPELLIVGTGSSGLMRVPDEVIRVKDFTMEIHRTGKACELYDQALEDGVKVAGAFHLSC